MPATMTAPRKTKRNARKAEPVRDAPAWNSVYINAVALPDGSTLVPWRPAFYLAERDGDGYALRDESIALDVYAPTVPELEAGLPPSSDTEDAHAGNAPLTAGKDRHSISPAPGQCRTSSIADSGAASAVGAGSICAGEDAGEQDREGGAE